MILYNNYYNRTITKDLASRFFYQNSFQIPTLEKLTVNIGIIDFNVKENLSIFILLEFITLNFPTLTKSKKNISFLNIRKNFPNGVKINLRKNKAYEFIQKLGFFIFPNFRKNKVFLNLKKTNSFSFSIREIDNFQEITFFYKYFKKIKELNISVKIKSLLNNKIEFLFFLSSFKFPVYLRK